MLILDEAKVGRLILQITDLKQGVLACTDMALGALLSVLLQPAINPAVSVAPMAMAIKRLRIIE